MPIQIVPLSVHNFTEVVREHSDEMPSIDTLKFQNRKCTEETVMHRVAAVTEAGRMVGFGMAVTGPWDPILKPGHFDITVRVDEEWKNKGIGGLIFAEVERFAINHGAIALHSSVSDSKPSDLAWVERRGFAATQHLFGSTLDLTSFDPGQFAESISAAEASGFRFTSVAEYTQEDRWFERFVDFYWQITKDVPGFSDVPLPSLEFMKKTFGQVDPARMFLFAHGDRWAAMSFILKHSDHDYYNNLTGVHPDYRGRGLATAIKAKSIEYLQSLGGTTLGTHNDSNNERMLTVNQKLGYQPGPGFFKLVRQLM